MATEFFYNKKNNAKTTITNNPLTNNGTSITLATGKGALFPTTYFLGVLWDDVTYPNNPTGDSQMEIVLCDSRSTDTVTVNSSGRGFAGTTGVQHASGSAFALLDMKEYWDMVEAALKTGWVPVTDSSIAYSSVDNPTGVITVSSNATTWASVGMRIKFTNNSNTVYGIVTAVTATTITFLHEIDPATPTQALHIMANSAITNFYYSTKKTPYGFPADPRSWTLQTTDTSDRSQSNPVDGTWYNPGSLSLTIHIGVWDVTYQAVLAGTKSSATGLNQYISLSTSSSSESDVDMTFFTSLSGASATLGLYAPVSRRKMVPITTKTPYYLIVKASTTNATVRIDGSNAKTIIRALCSYL